MEYDIIVIGGGAAGLTASETANMLGLKVALIEAKHIGGDCTWTGCVPSKALLACANVAHQARHAQRWGVHVSGVQVNFSEVMQHVHSTIQSIYHEEAPETLRAKGIDVFIARAQFASPHSITLSSGETLHAKRFIIAIGASSFIPPQFTNVPYLTHETLFDLTQQPEHLLIVGGGAVSVEMAQAFVRLGTKVTLITQEKHLLPFAEEESTHFLTQVLQREGVTVLTQTNVTHAQGNITLHLNTGEILQGSHLLIATGKRPNVMNLAPQNAQLETKDGAFVLTDTLRTSQKHIYAVGDVTGAPYFTHSAGSEAIAGILNQVLPFKSKKPLTAPYCIYTEPELAHVGMTEVQARQAYSEVHITCVPFTAIDRAMTEGKSEGFIKVIHGRYGKVYGVSMVGHSAGEMMNEWGALLAKGGRLHTIVFTPHIYPTMGYSNTIPSVNFLRSLAKNTTLGTWIKRAIRLLQRLS
jgi:pyruvate/2-oxoglutarate dehydrogenase complex dihydrolipoamide dehydrogenase (E3) component